MNDCFSTMEQSLQRNERSFQDNERLQNKERNDRLTECMIVSRQRTEQSLEQMNEYFKTTNGTIISTQ